MRTIVLLLISLFVYGLGAETIYKTVDENGNVIFTDKPSEDAEKIKIQELETIKNPNPGKYVPSSKPAQTSNYYKSLTITSPKADTAIRSNNGNLTVSVSLDPALNSGHKIEVLLDGKKVGTGNSVSIQNVDRGAHSVSARVVDGNGKNLISASSSFTLLRAGR